MADSEPGWLRRTLGGFLRLVDATRRLVLNVLFLLIVVVLAVALFTSSRPRLSENTALVVVLRGDLVEQYSGSAREAQLAEALGGVERETQLRDVVAVLDAAARDPNIARAVLILDDMGSAGMAKLNEVAAALERFRSAGKQILAWGSQMSQAQYYLAAHADQVYLHPSGAVLLTGLGGYRNYYRDALDRLGVTVNVFRVGKYKSFVEPFVNNAPSREAQEAESFWLNDAWTSYTGQVEQARKLPTGALGRMIDELPVRLGAAGGDLAKLALSEKLVDALMTRDELRALLIKRGAEDPAHKTFRQVSFQEYRYGLPDSGDRSTQVAVVVVQGDIVDGDAPQGAIGGRSTAELIRHARDDDTVKALVLRVDSPGGSAFGAELIRRELEITRKAGKPVIVSMSDVAASGGYWVSTSADEVLADPATITGSIGVFGLVPTFDKTLDKLGVHTGGVTTTWLAGGPDLRRPLDPRFGQVIQASVGHIYQEFLARAAASRHATAEQIEEVAQGRVWTGRQAHERHLVDGFGGLAAAIHDAAQHAKLTPGFRTMYIELEPKGLTRLLDLFAQGAARAALQMVGPVPTGLLFGADAPAAGVGADFKRLLSNGVTPRVLAHCLCQAP
ncbi:MAG: signal peptide peptidase SppA [Betaproteobacteria bacterium]|nr:MAG: signal peptide peptidase SppA [Betaproteobacteria bacterium]